MICPNDNIEMQQVKIISHYGQPIFLEQCKCCGGIWFDESELYRAKQGEAEKIELLDSVILRTPSTIESSIHVCPRDKTDLFRFMDPYFPKDIIVERCPTCNGFWLNRGEFAKYQEARQELLRPPKEKNPEDIKLEEDIKRILELHQTGDNDDLLKRLGKFLSKPLDTNAVIPLESTQRSNEEGNSLNLLLNILMTILRIFIFR
jgi:Zn-finger nucleic acid-binding protein